MIDTYLDVMASKQREKENLERMQNNAPVPQQGAGALGPSASVEQSVAEPERVVTASAQAETAFLFADGMGRELARRDYVKLAQDKLALNMAPILSFAGKHPAAIGAAIGGVGSALTAEGGIGNKLRAGVGGAALGAGIGHAGHGIGSRMAGGQGFMQAAGEYGTGVRRAAGEAMGRLRGKAAPAAAAAAPAKARPSVPAPPHSNVRSGGVDRSRIQAAAPVALPGGPPPVPAAAGRQADFFSEFKSQPQVQAAPANYAADVGATMKGMRRQLPVVGNAVAPARNDYAGLLRNVNEPNYMGKVGSRFKNAVLALGLG